MSKDIGDVLPKSEQLEGEKMTKENLENKIMTIQDFVLMPSSYEGQSDFCIVQADVAGKLVTFAGSSVISKNLSKITREGIKEAGGIKCKLTKVIGKKGRGYWDISSAK